MCYFVRASTSVSFVFLVLYRRNTNETVPAIMSKLNYGFHNNKKYKINFKGGSNLYQT